MLKDKYFLNTIKQEFENLTNSQTNADAIPLLVTTSDLENDFSIDASPFFKALFKCFNHIQTSTFIENLGKKCGVNCDETDAIITALLDIDIESKDLNMLNEAVEYVVEENSLASSASDEIQLCCNLDMPKLKEFLIDSEHTDLVKVLESF
ncbi:hypothetical protein [Photobacterium damselae]|uniref:hypothetical protein n=1 Tax=Photobacterium damselae TaxID=38293 RepID=UPI001F2E571D|nr:hypothetical protein [Photobacterium damselae]UKA04771.1 hypothetical protein IHC89_21250 [Photobacterium damselae subsp. damselae]